MSALKQEVLPGGVAVPFADVAAALATGRDPASRSTPPRTLAATVVAVCSAERLLPAAAALQKLSTRASVRAILISEGSETRPSAYVAEDAVAIPNLQAPFVNNAVAALRLSSLPTIVWWRGCSPAMLGDLADLADRVVLDDPEPRKMWRAALDLFDDTAFSDLRWTRLTRWRTLMAHFFDIPEVAAAATRFERLLIRGSDRHAASLFAAWLTAALERTGRIAVRIEQGDRDGFLEEIILANDAERLVLRLGSSGACISTSSVVEGHRSCAQTIFLGEQDESALMAEELRIRSRDRAFEGAVRACLADAS